MPVAMPQDFRKLLRFGTVRIVTAEIDDQAGCRPLYIIPSGHITIFCTNRREPLLFCGVFLVRRVVASVLAAVVGLMTTFL